VLLPVDASMSTTTAINVASPSATRGAYMMPVSKRRIMTSGSNPMIEDRTPVMPTSVMNAVPAAVTRASAVGTCVCVPRTADIRPSSKRSIAAFSAVASA